MYKFVTIEHCQFDEVFDHFFPSNFQLVSGPIPNSASLTGGFIHPLHTSTGMHNYAGSECDLPNSSGELWSL